MRSYIITGQQEEREQLEELIDKHEFTVKFRSRILPIYVIQSERDLEDLTELFTGYHIAPPKEYTIDPQKP